MKRFDWDKHKFVFNTDGSLRDIYVFDTDEHDWDYLLKFAQRENAPFNCDGKPHPLPDRITGVNFGEFAQILTFQRGKLDINCHLFTLDEIEMDIDPRQVTDQSSFDDVLSFLQDLGSALNKNVVLTDEACPESVWFSYDAQNDEISYCSPE